MTDHDHGPRCSTASAAHGIWPTHEAAAEAEAAAAAAALPLNVADEYGRCSSESAGAAGAAADAEKPDADEDDDEEGERGNAGVAGDCRRVVSSRWVASARSASQPV